MASVFDTLTYAVSPFEYDVDDLNDDDMVGW